MESLLIRKLNDRSYVPFFDINGDIAKLIADSAYKGDKDYLLVPIPIPDAERSRKKNYLWDLNINQNWRNLQYLMKKESKSIKE